MFRITGTQSKQDELVSTRTGPSHTNHQNRKTQHQTWKKCKLLGSLLDTVSDIERRKTLALNSLQHFEHIYKSKRISIKVKIRTFNTYTPSIFLFNFELWTLTETLQDSIDFFQHRLLRRVINIRWPKLISSEKLYTKVGAVKWSTPR